MDLFLVRLAWLPVCLACLSAAPCSAFYNHNDDNNKIELRGFTRFYGGMQQYPIGNQLYDQRHDESWGAVFRLLANADSGGAFSLSANILEVARSVALTGLNTAPAAGIERSGLLISSQHESADSSAYLEADSFYCKLQTDKADISVGRQPINLATTFYFTPNDFFAPFIAQDFYRVYKPGVDSGRINMRLGDLSVLSIIGVLGYSHDITTDNGWSTNPDWNDSSLVGRISAALVDFEWALLGGTVHNTDVIGGSLQGELFDWLGVRAEGHHGSPKDKLLDDYFELAAGLEHRFADSLDLHLEYFYNGLGFSSIEAASTALSAGNLSSPYLGKNYTGLGISYEFTPLLTGEILAIANWTDHSQLISINAVYSLADEAELVVTLSAPFGEKPEGLTIRSEYGTLPDAFAIEYRLYF